MLMLSTKHKVRGARGPVLSRGGFTLIEMLVSVAVFSVVMTIALGSLLAISESDRKAQTLKSVVNNLNFSLDAMTRSIRTGINYDCNPTLPLSANTPPTATDCNSGATTFAFYSAEGRTVVYCRGTASPLSCSASGTSILRSTDGGSSWASITAPEVRISRLTFLTIGAQTGDGIQPKTTILLSGTVSVGTGNTSSTTLQTTVTQRIYDQ